MFKAPEHYRLTAGKIAEYNSTSHDGNNGVFIIPNDIDGDRYEVIASDGCGWEHVSVNGCQIPSWETMCWVKSLFWGPADLVVQLHVPEKEYVNHHASALHLWRKSNDNSYCLRPPMQPV